MESATPSLPSPLLVPPSDPGASGLSQLQREWARQFILTGGNALEAARLAGYTEASAHGMSHKNLQNPAVMAYVKQLSVADAQQHLPRAIAELARMAFEGDPAKIKPDMKRKCLLDIIELAGVKRDRGGINIGVAVQVGSNGEAQRLIGEVWSAKQSRMSDIPTAMPDTIDALEGEVRRIEAAADDAAADHGRGGDHLQGPRPGPVPLPPHSAASSSNSETEGQVAARFGASKATDEGSEEHG